MRSTLIYITSPDFLTEEKEKMEGKNKETKGKENPRNKFLVGWPMLF